MILWKTGQHKFLFRCLKSDPLSKKVFQLPSEVSNCISTHGAKHQLIQINVVFTLKTVKYGRSGQDIYIFAYIWIECCTLHLHALIRFFSLKLGINFYLNDIVFARCINQPRQLKSWWLWAYQETNDATKFYAKLSTGNWWNVFSMACFKLSNGLTLFQNKQLADTYFKYLVNVVS